MKKKLELKKEIVAQLDDDKMAEIKGGEEKVTGQECANQSKQLLSCKDQCYESLQVSICYYC